MYFVYSKTINIASDYNYDTIEMINYFIDQFNPIEEYFSECGIDSEPDDFVMYIFETSENWFDSFAQYIGLEENIINMISEGVMSENELVEQISNAISTDLENYYTKHWEEYKKEYLKETK